MSCGDGRAPWLALTPPATPHALCSPSFTLRAHCLEANSGSNQLQDAPAAGGATASPPLTLALHFACYSFVRIHSAIRVTPATDAGLTDHVWTLKELLSKIGQ